MTTALRQLVETGIVDDFYITAWGLAGETAADVRTQKQELRSSTAALRLEMKALRAAHKAEKKTWAEKLKKHKALVKQLQAQARKAGDAFVAPAIEGEAPSDKAIKSLQVRIEDNVKKESWLRIPPEREEKGAAVRALAALLPDGVAELDFSASVVRVTSPTKRCRYSFFVRSMAPVMPVADGAVPAWTPSKWLAQALQAREGLGAAESDGEYIWRTDGHSYIFTTDDVPAKGFHSVANYSAALQRDIPAPGRLMDITFSGKETTLVLQVLPEVLAKAVQTVAGMVPETGVVQLVATAHDAEVLLCVDGTGAFAFCSSAQFAVEWAAAPVVTQDCRYDMTAAYLVRMLNAAPRGEPVTLALCRASAADRGAMMFSCATGEGILLACRQ